MQVVRRISGGGAMFMEAGNCITFSLVVPESLVDGLSYEESYAFLNQWVLGALADVDVQASLTGLNDIASPEGKLAGPPSLIDASASMKGPLLMQSAVSAQDACQPYAMLPADRYKEWKILDLTFTPQDFINAS